MPWNQTSNDDNGSLFTGALRLQEGDLIQIEGEPSSRRVSYVMGSDRKGWRACAKGHGVFPLGPVRWRVVAAGSSSAIMSAPPAGKEGSSGDLMTAAARSGLGDCPPGLEGEAVYIGFDSAWTEGNVGAVSAIAEDPVGRTQFLAPVPLRFRQAVAKIQSFSPGASLRVLAIDQPTIVANSVGGRPVELAVAGVVGAMRGGVQMASRSRAGMFDDAAPIWKLLHELDYQQQPFASRPRSGAYVLEVYPCLNILGLVPDFLDRRRCAKYNPRQKKTFDIHDWRRLCQFLSSYGKRHDVTGLDEWADGHGQLARPRKADQDRLDAALTAILAHEWAHGGVAAASGLVVGDTATGYMFTPADAALVELLSASAQRRSVPIFKLW